MNRIAVCVFLLVILVAVSIVSAAGPGSPNRHGKRTDSMVIQYSYLHADFSVFFKGTTFLMKGNGR